MHVYSTEELKNMTDEQVKQAIQKDLFEDAYATQKRERIAFRGKNLALGMESAIFTCPVCGKMDSLHSDSQRLYCDCGFEAVYDVYGDLTDRNGQKYSITELDIAQKENLCRKVKDADAEECLFSDQVTMYEIGKNHELLKTETGTLKGYADRFECCGRLIRFEEMQGMAIYSRNALIIHMTGMEGHMEIKSEQAFCGLKYVYLYETKE